jgi:hypothetical protein
VKKNTSVVLAFLLGAAFGRAMFREAGHILNTITFGKRNN